MEFLISGVSACCAGIVTNPLDVVKTRLQLQGELKARGKYTVHYKNVFHGLYAVIRSDGVTAVQKGLVPALCYQFVMNGFRLGLYTVGEKAGLHKNSAGDVVTLKCVLMGATSGTLGACIASPFYMVSSMSVD